MGEGDGDGDGDGDENDNNDYLTVLALQGSPYQSKGSSQAESDPP